MMQRGEGCDWRLSFRRDDALALVRNRRLRREFEAVEGKRIELVRESGRYER